MPPPTVETRLRAAVDASLAWYEALCAQHGVRCGIEDDTWIAYDPPPALHSVAKTVEPDAGPERALAAIDVHGQGAIADSFGAFDLTAAGFRLLIAARWIHHPAPTVGRRTLPACWSVVRTPDDLAAWTAHIDTSTVLLPGLLDRSGFTLFVRHRNGGPVGGAVTHLCSGVVELSNVWSDDADLAWPDLLTVVAARHPGRAVVGYEHGAALQGALAAGFADVGPQHVWLRP